MAEQTHEKPSERIISVRKLVALDIVLHGPWLILAEFAFSIVLGAALGLWIISSAFPVGHAGSLFKLLAGGYGLCLAINYVPMLLYAIAIVRRRSAHHEVAAELTEKARYARKYGVQSLLLILPLVIPAIAIMQEGRQGRRLR